MLSAAGVAAALLSLSCGGSEDPVWLAIADGDSITVEEASEAWSALDQGQRDYYLRFEIPGEDLVRSLAMKGIVERLADSLGYTGDARCLAFRDSWLRTEAFIARSGMIHEEIVAEVTLADLDFCAQHAADTVWLTAMADSAPGLDLGGFGLAALPHPVAVSLAEAGEGAILPIGNGLSLRVDSLSEGGAAVSPDSPALPADLADSTGIWVLAQSRQRFLNLTDRYGASIDYSVSIDTSAVFRVTDFFAGRTPSLPEDTVMASGLVTCTSRGLAYEMEFYQARIPLDPSQPMWAMMTLENMVIQSLRVRDLEARAPLVMDSLENEADSYLMGMALDSLFRDSVAAMVNLTDEDIEEEFQLMDSVVLIPEKRVLLGLYLPPDQEGAFLDAVEAGTEGSLLESLQGLPFLFRDAQVSRTTAPLIGTDVPEEHREAVFSMTPGDTTLLGPFPMDRMPGFALYRVLEVIPEHPAELSEIRPELRQAAMNRQQVELMEEWLDRLGERHGFRIDIEAIQRLPLDPGQWGAVP
jgi:hypothetical protein